VRTHGLLFTIGHIVTALVRVGFIPWGIHINLISMWHGCLCPSSSSIRPDWQTTKVLLQRGILWLVTSREHCNVGVVGYEEEIEWSADAAESGDTEWWADYTVMYRTAIYLLTYCGVYLCFAVNGGYQFTFTRLWLFVLNKHRLFQGRSDGRGVYRYLYPQNKP